MLLDQPETIRARLLALIGKREYSRAQLVAKLADKCSEAELLEQLLDELEAAGVVDDERYCQALVQQRHNDGWGYLRINQDLRAAGIASELQERHLPAMSDNDYWSAQALQLLQRKYGSEQSLKAQPVRTKAFAYLQRRGFTSAQALRAIEGFTSSE